MTTKEKIYNILADFVLVVDDCHKRGVEPSCEKEIEKINALLTLSESRVRGEIVEMIEGMKPKDTTAQDLRSGVYRQGDGEYREGRTDMADDIIKKVEDK